MMLFISNCNVKSLKHEAEFYGITPLGECVCVCACVCVCIYICITRYVSVSVNRIMYCAYICIQFISTITNLVIQFIHTSRHSK